MSLDSLRVLPVVIQQAARETDRYGNSVLDWDNITETTVDGWIGPSPRGGRPEVGVGDDRREEDKYIRLLYLPTGTDITNRDRVVADGLTYEVDEPPFLARTPRGPHHIEVTLRAVVG